MISRRQRFTRHPLPLRAALFAGLAAGTAEVFWVSAYATATGADALPIAREVAASVIPGLGAHAAAPSVGIGIHFALSAALAIAFVSALWRACGGRPAPALIALAAVSVLALVWSGNFLLLLPSLNPAFLEQMPRAATFASKLLFGLTMAWMLGRNAGVASCSSATPLPRIRQPRPSSSDLAAR